MKGLKKCFYFCATLMVVSLAYCLVFPSANIYALKHDVKYIPLGSETNLGSTSFSSPGIYFEWSRPNIPTQNFNRNQNHWFTSRVSNDRCTFVASTDRYYTSPTTHSTYVGSDLAILDFRHRFDSYRYSYVSSQYSSSPYVPCMQTTKYGSLLSYSTNLSLHPNFDSSSLVNIPIADRPPFESLPPYYYDYDSAYVDDVAIDSDSGIHYSNSLTMASIVGFSPTKFRRFMFPLGYINTSTTGEFIRGRNFKLTALFDFSGDNTYFEWNPDLPSNSYFRLYAEGRNEQESVQSSASYHSQYVDCTSNLVSLPLIGHIQLEFTCDMTSDYDYYNGQTMFYLDLSSGTDSGTYLFDTNANWSISSAYFVSDNDSTPGSSWGFEPTGNNLSSAPGSASGLIPGDEDWFSSLTNLFGFSFLNPFAPLFTMFSDSSECSHIPVISGMLGADDDTYCPWFNNSIRGILTPVFSIASIMLVFGFAVRWLGASSGNMFEDQTTHKWGKIQFKQGGK